MTIHVTPDITSEHLDLPELRPFIGKQVEITIQESVPSLDDSRWDALEAIGGTDLIDADVVQRHREFDAQQQKAADDSP